MIKRYYSTTTTTITNQYIAPGMTVRATGSNQSLRDVTEIFSVYGNQNSGSQELSRMLIKFPIDQISTDRINNTIAQSGSVSFYLRLFNAPHSFTGIKKATYSILPVSQSWNEDGHGLWVDDNGVPNWITSSGNSDIGYTAWGVEGGNYISSSYTPGSTLPYYTYYMEDAYDNVELDITSYIEEVIAGTFPNYGLGIMLTSSTENALSSSYTKYFFARGSEYFYKRPILECRQDSSYKDARANFYNSSSLASAGDNLNTLYLYNYVRGQLKNIPDISTGSIYLKIFTTATGSNEIRTTTPTYPVTGGYHSVGVYTASFALNTSASVVYDRWYGTNFTTCYFTGSAITVKSLNSYNFNPSFNYVATITNLKPAYSPEEKANFRVFVRDKDHQPTIYNVARNNAQGAFVEDLYYRVKRVTDGLVVVDWGTSSATNHTRLSYGESGSYFDLDMSLFEAGYMYQINLLYKTTANDYRQYKEAFKFRVEK